MFGSACRHGKFAQAAWAVLLLCVLVAAAWLRLDGLGRHGLWDDELFAADIVLNRPLLPADGAPWLRQVRLADVQADDTFWTLKGADQSPPLFELLGKAAVAVLGDGEAALRMSSALCAVLLLAWLAWRAWQGLGAGQGRDLTQGVVFLTVLVLTAFCGPLVAYAQEARAYGLGVALVTPLVALFWQRVAQGWRTAPLPGWGEVALAAAASMAHYNALILAGLCLACYSVEALRRRDGPALAALARMGLVLALVLGWGWLAASGIRDGRSGAMGWMAPLPLGQVLALMGRRFAGEVMGHVWLALGGLMGGLAMLRLLTCRGLKAGAGATAPCGCADLGLWRAVAALAGLGAAYVLILAWVMQQSRIEHPRHLLFMLPLLFFITGSWLALLVRGGRWWRAAGVALLLGMVLTHAQAIGAVRQWPKSGYRDAAAFLQQGLQDGDTVLAGWMLNAEGAYSYYFGPRAGRHWTVRVLRGPDSVAQFCPPGAGTPAAPAPTRLGVVYPAAAQPVVDALVRQCSHGWHIEKFEQRNVRAQLWTRAAP